MGGFLGITVKRLAPCRCLHAGSLKNPTECLWRWELDRGPNFFLSPPAHLCAVTYNICLGSHRKLILTAILIRFSQTNLKTREKGRDLTQSYDKSPYTNRNAHSENRKINILIKNTLRALFAWRGSYNWNIVECYVKQAINSTQQSTCWVHHTAGQKEVGYESNRTPRKEKKNEIWYYSRIAKVRIWTEFGSFSIPLTQNELQPHVDWSITCYIRLWTEFGSFSIPPTQNKQ